MPADSLTTTFAALADPTRRAILARLASGACSVTELAHPFEMSLPAVSKHLRVLERAGLVARGREAQYRPVAIDASPLREVADWAEHYRHLWEGRLDRLGAYLRELQSNPRPAAAHERPAANPAAPRADAATRPASRTADRTPEARPAAARERAAANQKENPRHARKRRRS